MMVAEQLPQPITTQPPPHTVVVLPKPLPMNRGALWALFWTLGVLMGLFARTIIDGPGDLDLASSGTGQPSQPIAAAEERPTMEVHVRAILELPSPTPTNTPKPAPTSTPDPASGGNFCADVEPGKLCRVPFPPPPTPTPYPSCAEMDRLSPGDWCVWPTEPAVVAGDR